MRYPAACNARGSVGNSWFQLLMAGYFVCGFQIVFIGVHLPSYLKDHGLSPGVATTASNAPNPVRSARVI